MSWSVITGSSSANRYLIYYNNYRLHSGLGWQTPASRYTGCIIPVTGLAALPGLEGMATDPIYGPAAAGPPISITPRPLATSGQLWWLSDVKMLVDSTK